MRFKVGDYICRYIHGEKSKWKVRARIVNISGTYYTLMFSDNTFGKRTVQFFSKEWVIDEDLMRKALMGVINEV